MTSRLRAALAATATAAILAACATTGTTAARPAKPAASTAPAKPIPPGLDPAARPDAFPSTYQPLPSRPTAIRGATILTATGQRIENGVIVFAEGKIVSVGGTDTPLPAGVTVIDGTGKWVTPGIIDVHSHLGVYSSPGVSAHEDGNEMSSPVTPNVWAEHAIWPQDPGFGTALAGGVTSMQILPGSGNLIGGRGVTVKNVSAVTYQAMKFPGAPWGLKMA